MELEGRTQGPVPLRDAGDYLLDPRVPANSRLPNLPCAAELLFGNSIAEKKLYWDRSHYDSPESQMIALEKSSTLYIGNLAFSTHTMHIRSHFSQMGPVKAVHLGLNKNTRTPCGFAFVEYYDRRNALDAVAYLTGTKLDGRVIRVELDAGFKPGREFGRGTTGGQMRDERRRMIDPARSKRDATTPNPGAGLQEEGRATFFGGPEKRDRGDEYQGADDHDRPEKNPRFREE